MRWAEAAGSAGAFERHFIQVQLAEEHGAGCFESPRDFRIFGRHAILENARCRSGFDSRGIDVVFESDRNAVQPAGDAPRLALAVAFPRLFAEPIPQSA